MSLEVDAPTLSKFLKFTDNLESGVQCLASLNRQDEELMDLSLANYPLTKIQATLEAVIADQHSIRQAIDEAVPAWLPPCAVACKAVSAIAPSIFSHT